MEVIKINRELCKGCLLCTTVCPTGIISKAGKVNSKGYFPAMVEDAKQGECKQCAFCSLMCPDAAIVVLKKEKQK